MAAKDVVVKVRLDKRLAARLDRLARRKAMTRSAALRAAIEIAERDLDREEALGTLVEQAETDYRALAGKRPQASKFALR